MRVAARSAPHAPTERQPDLLVHARYLAQVENKNLLEHHSVAVTDGRIVDILPSSLARECYTPASVVELDQHLLIPGLVNLHTHAAMSLMRGIADDLPLDTWLKTVIWPLEATMVSPDFVRDGTRLACAEMLLGGVTMFNDMYFFPDAAIEAVVEMGMRAAIGIIVMEFPCHYAANAPDYLHKGLACFDQWRHHPLAQFCLAPHAPYSVSDASFAQVQTLAAQLELPIHLHLHETAGEIRRHLEEFGCRPLHRLMGLGMLGGPFIGVHATHLLPDELAVLARHNASIAHCPAANLKLGSGVAPVPAMLAEGINVGLGTDGAASNNRLDIFSEMRLASLLAKGTSGDAAVLPAWQALHMATLGGAMALGREQDIGSLTVGKFADMAAVRLDALSLSPCFDPVSHLVYVAGREDVSHVWVGGQCRVFDRMLLETDTDFLKKRLGLWQNRLVSCLKPGGVV
jgi:5-methylthioadenosine/S-adenosylhomocysteine deaminase